MSIADIDILALDIGISDLLLPLPVDFPLILPLFCAEKTGHTRLFFAIELLLNALNIYAVYEAYECFYSIVYSFVN